MQRLVNLRIFNEISDNLMANLNLSHMHLASSYNFSIKNFLNYLKPKIAAIEISSNNGIDDQHLPLKNCINLEYLKYLNIKKPIILEFRNSNLSQIKNINILKKLIMRIKLKYKKISKNESCFIIAEAGVNHNGSLKIAKQLVDIAVEAKADAVKFQHLLLMKSFLKTPKKQNIILKQQVLTKA